MRVRPVRVGNDQVAEMQGWQWSSRINCVQLNFPTTRRIRASRGPYYTIKTRKLEPPDGPPQTRPHHSLSAIEQPVAHSHTPAALFRHSLH
jgi:hypothetical protein